MNTVYHPGELAVQARAGVEVMAGRVGRGIKAEIPAAAQEFLEQQSMIIVASPAATGQVWASILTGPPGFIRVLDAQTVQIEAVPWPDDPLASNLPAQPELGLLAIDFATRRRLRLNGRAELWANGSFAVQARQVYANCPKYIQARQVESTLKTERGSVKSQRSEVLTARQQQWIGRADTFFIATAHPQGGADASHRGGQPGFVTIIDSTHLVWPDYAGNAMFNTLGNIAANPPAGLLFLDFERGSTLQLTGQATIIWDEAEIKKYQGAERLVAYQIEQVIEAETVLPWQWRFESYSPFNP